MSDTNLNENKVIFLRTDIPKYPNYQIPEDIGQGLSEERKRYIEDQIYKFLDDYLKADNQI